MTNKKDKILRAVRMVITDIVPRECNLSDPHDVEYNITYDRLTEKGHEDLDFTDHPDHPEFLEVTDILANAIISTLLDNVEDPALAMKLSNVTARKIMRGVAEGANVSIVSSPNQLRDLLTKQGVPRHLIDETIERLEQESEKQNGVVSMPRDSMLGLEDADLTESQKAALALTLSSPSFRNNNSEN